MLIIVYITLSLYEEIAFLNTLSFDKTHSICFVSQIGHLHDSLAELALRSFPSWKLFQSKGAQGNAKKRKMNLQLTIGCLTNNALAAR